MNKVWFWNEMYNYLIPYVLKNDVEETHTIEIRQIDLSTQQLYFSGFKQVYTGTGSNKIVKIPIVNPNANIDNVYVITPDENNETKETGFAWLKTDNEDELIENRKFMLEEDNDELCVKVFDLAEGLQITIFTPEKKDLVGEPLIYIDGVTTPCRKVDTLAIAYDYTEIDDNGIKLWKFKLPFEEITLRNVKIVWTERNSDLKFFCKILFRSYDKIKEKIDIIPEQKIPNLCQEEALDSLAVEYGLPLLVYSMVDEKRKLLSNLPDIYKLKGTELVFQLIRYLLGFKVEIKQLWSADYKKFKEETEITDLQKLHKNIININWYKVE